MDSGQSESPLVSVGIPTYNRPEGLRQTLDAMRGQTWRNLEIVVSDNASPNPEVEAVGRAAAAEDQRVRYIRQRRNLGGGPNFRFVLEEAKGEYFLWAADDDAWEPFFIERCVEAHLAFGSAVTLVQMAVPLTCGRTVFPQLDQGRGFRAPIDGTAADRIANFLHNAYANLVYGVFRRSALFLDGEIAANIANELQLLMFAAANGEIIALPEIGMYKSVPRRKVYDHQRWEIEGGLRPQWWRPRNIPKMLRYHRQVIDSIRAGLQKIDLTADERASLEALSTKILRQHAFHMAINWIPRSSVRKA